MPRFARFPRFRRSLAALVALTHLAACYRFTTRPELAPQELVTAEHPGNVRVTLTDGTRHDLERPSATGDSLLGTRNGRRWSAPMARVRQIEVRQMMIVPTVIGVSAAVGLGLLATVGMVALIEAGARDGADWVACEIIDPFCPPLSGAFLMRRYTSLEEQR